MCIHGDGRTMSTNHRAFDLAQGARQLSVASLSTFNLNRVYSARFLCLELVGVELRVMVRKEMNEFPIVIRFFDLNFLVGRCRFTYEAVGPN